MFLDINKELPTADTRCRWVSSRTRWCDCIVASVHAEFPSAFSYFLGMTSERLILPIGEVGQVRGTLLPCPDIYTPSLCVLCNMMRGSKFQSKKKNKCRRCRIPASPSPVSGIGLTIVVAHLINGGLHAYPFSPSMNYRTQHDQQHAGTNVQARNSEEQQKLVES
jgi:hypothetical protein